MVRELNIFHGNEDSISHLGGCETV